jgi:hypothetical protein
MAMYDPTLQWAVLRLLDRWGRLPLSDLERMLDPLERLRFRDALVRDMEWEQLVTVRVIGDEEIVELAPRGRARLAERRPTTPAEHPPDRPS